MKPASRPILVTGGAGFIGSNLADRLAAEGREVVVFDALARPGVERNLAWLEERHPGLSSRIGDVRDDAAVAEAARDAACIFHLAAQVAVTTSMADPVDDFAVNIQGTLNLLEAARATGRRTPVIYASTNKVYGDLADVALEEKRDAYVPLDPEVRASGIGEERPLDFHTPYGCSKGAADQYVLDYSRSFDLPTCVLRMSCIYGPRQMGTEDQGWVAHFLIRALNREPVTIYGDGKQVRDILHVGDAVQAYLNAWSRIERVKGRAFNLGGGPSNAVSLLQLLDHMGGLLGRTVEREFGPWRAGDQRYYVSDAARARRELGLPRPMDWRRGVADLLAWLDGERAERRSNDRSVRAAREAAL